MAKNTALFIVLALFAMALLIGAEANYDQYILGKRVYGFGSQAWTEDHGYGSQPMRNDHGYGSQPGRGDHMYESELENDDHGYGSDRGKDDHGHGPSPGKDDNGYGPSSEIRGYPYRPIGRAVWPFPIGYWHHRLGPWWWLRDEKTPRGMAGAPTSP